jgi:hypothetical protein
LPRFTKTLQKDPFSVLSHGRPSISAHRLARRHVDRCNELLEELDTRILVPFPPVFVDHPVPDPFGRSLGIAL